MRCFGATEELVTLTKTNENRSVRTGQSELANRRHGWREPQIQELWVPEILSHQFRKF